MEMSLPMLGRTNRRGFSNVQSALLCASVTVQIFHSSTWALGAGDPAKGKRQPLVVKLLGAAGDPYAATCGCLLLRARA